MIESAGRNEALDRLEATLEYDFNRRELFEQALRHSSYTHERSTQTDGEKPVDNNERLEFLGDAVLAVVVAHSLYLAKPDWREGDLTRALHAIVEGRSLAKLARSLDVGPAILLGRTERQSGGQEKPSILENTMEAIIGAIYLDGGLGSVTAFVERAFADALAANAAPVRRDPKTELQERVMSEVGEFPSYRVINDSLVEGDENRFTVEVVLQERPLARGVGRTKRAGERLAAAAALKVLQADQPTESLCP